ncbi:MAG: hypothetical protein FD177_2574 [Desulfovibrionaceae bacterium]|nr:MAG: hypothetical protein FD177_2574 [Desulfovibrionaceae bacterium]
MNTLAAIDECRTALALTMREVAADLEVVS